MRKGEIPMMYISNNSTTSMGTRRAGPNRGLVAGLVAGALLLASCGGGDDVSGTTSTTQGTSTTVTAELTTTTQAQITTTTVAAGTTTTAAVTTTTIDTNSLAEGSGCTPGSDESLPDGEWFGYVDEASAGEVDFDLACWFAGDAAALAAAEDGEESPPPNDYYVRNVNPTIRAIEVGGDATVTWLPSPGDPSTEETIPYSDWITLRDTRDYQPGIWLTIEDGRVVEIQEQYVP